MTGRRVVITGMDVVCPLGNTLSEAWNNLIAGRSGVARVTAFDTEGFPSQIAGEVKNFNADAVVDKKNQRRYDRFSLFSVAAARAAWVQSGISEGQYNPSRMGCILGVGIGGLLILEENHKEMLEKGPRRVSPFLIPAMISNLAPGNVAIDLGLHGINYTVTSACTSGTHAIGEAFRMIAEGVQDVVVTGGAEAAITPLALAGFGRMQALSTRNDDPERASRPFDRDRDGFVIGEGAGVLVLESYDAARSRGASIIAEVIGYGASCDAYHITKPSENGEGAKQCMRLAVESAQIPFEQVGYINAHGTSTPANDISETAAIKDVFGAHATRGLLVSSTKSMTGHLLGAAGGLEAVISAKVVQTGMVPPTINLDNPSEGCDLDYVAHTAREASIEVAMSNSFGFGGTNASIIVRRV